VGTLGDAFTVAATCASQGNAQAKTHRKAAMPANARAHLFVLSMPEHIFAIFQSKYRRKDARGLTFCSALYITEWLYNL
jgi:hypothetical protein